MHHFLLQILGVAIIRMGDWWILLALGLHLPLSVPAAVPCTHLTMHDFLLQILGVAIIRMGDWWVLLALGLLLPLSVPAAVPCTHLTMASEGRHVSEGSFCRIPPRRHLRYKLGTPECWHCNKIFEVLEMQWTLQKLLMP